MNHTRTTSPIAVICFLFFIFITEGTLSSQAFSVPISDLVFKGKISIHGKAAEFKVRDGTMLTVRDEDKLYFYGFLTFSEKDTRWSLLLLEIESQETGQSVRQLSHIKEFLRNEIIEIPTPHGRFMLEMVDSFSATFPSMRPLDKAKPRPGPSELQRLFGRSGGGTCCVSCGPLTLCAISVTMDCGSCE